MLDGRLHVPEPGDDEHLGVRPGLAAPLDHRQPVEVGHPQVGEDDVEGVLVDLGGTGLAAGGHGAAMTSALQALGNRLGEVPIVVNEEVIGAVGVTGAGEGASNEACAQAGVNAILAATGGPAPEGAAEDAEAEDTVAPAEEETEETAEEATPEPAEEATPTPDAD